MSTHSEASPWASLFEDGLLRLDVEFGNARTFFSGSKRRPELYSAGSLPSVDYDAEIPGASFSIGDHVTINGNSLSRSLIAETCGDSLLFDLVSRYVLIDRSRSRQASINGKAVRHACSNLYHQYSAGFVRVPLGRDSWLEFTGSVIGDMPAHFEHVFYVRDEAVVADGNRWIVHHRMIATADAEIMTLRGCNRLLDGPVPGYVNALVPRFIKRRLFRIRERERPNFPFMVVGENRMAARTRIGLRTKVTLHV